MSETNSTKKLASGIITVFIANVINLVFSFGTNLILPKYLSVESYAAIKTYQLYITYVGVMHFGYSDGMYLKYGGKELSQINMDDLMLNLSTLRFFQIVMCVLCVSISLTFKDSVLLMSSLVLLPMNLKAYFQSLYQAIGEFKIYSRIMNYVTGVTFVINAILIFLFKTDNYLFYLGCYVALNVAIWLFLEIHFSVKTGIKIVLNKFSFFELVSQIRSGILIMLGNFSDAIMTSMDRLFVKFFIGTAGFAQYAFAVSMEHFISVAVSPLSITLYNYLCKNIDKNHLKQLRGVILIFSALLVTCLFPLTFIINHFVPKYNDAIKVLSILFAAQIFFTIVKCFYNNLYKARKEQRKYFLRWVIIIFVAFISNIVFYLLFRNKESFAYATFFTSLAWFTMSAFDFKDLEYDFKDFLFLSLEVVGFLYCTKMNCIAGCILYFVLTIALSIILMREYLLTAAGIVNAVLKRKK